MRITRSESLKCLALGCADVVMVIVVVAAVLKVCGAF
jgi:hypothetical protein